MGIQLRDIFKNEELKNKSEIYGVSVSQEDCDVEYSTPPENLETIGLLFKLDADGTGIDDNLLDVIINYHLSNVAIQLEIDPADISEDKMSVSNLMQLASNVSFDISILPPNHPLTSGTCSFERYKEVLNEFTQEMLERTNFERFVAPISNFLQYLMTETILGEEHEIIKNYKPENQYIIDNFVNVLTEEQSNDFKNGIRQTCYDYFGSKEGFLAHCQVIFDVIIEDSYEKILNAYKAHFEKLKAEEAKNATQEDGERAKVPVDECDAKNGASESEGGECHDGTCKTDVKK